MPLELLTNWTYSCFTPVGGGDLDAPLLRYRKCIRRAVEVASPYNHHRKGGLTLQQQKGLPFSWCLYYNEAYYWKGVGSMRKWLWLVMVFLLAGCGGEPAPVEVEPVAVAETVMTQPTETEPTTQPTTVPVETEPHTAPLYGHRPGQRHV